MDSHANKSEDGVRNVEVAPVRQSAFINDNANLCENCKNQHELENQGLRFVRECWNSYQISVLARCTEAAKKWRKLQQVQSARRQAEGAEITMTVGYEVEISKLTTCALIVHRTD